MVSQIVSKKAKSKRMAKTDRSKGEGITLSKDELDGLMEIWSALAAIMQAGKSSYYKDHPGEFVHLISALGFIEKGLGDLINSVALRSIAD
jgi:hypothetical protein